MGRDTPIGPMRQLVTIQARTVAQNSYGEAVQTWTTVATRWGNLEPLSGREVWQAQQVRPDVTHRVTLRYYDGLTPKHRVVIDGQTFGVVAVVNPDGRKRFHELTCVQEITS